MYSPSNIISPNSASSLYKVNYGQWRSQEFTSGWGSDYFSIFLSAQTQKFEDLPMSLHFI
jgi:hypothetical protein